MGRGSDKGAVKGGFSVLFLLFIFVPIVELWLLIQVGSSIGATSTVMLVLATGVGGAALARREGLRTLMETQRAMNHGEMPHAPMFDGLAILFGGLLLLTPGILTDLLGFALLVPVSREVLKGYIMRWVQSKVQSGAATVQYTASTNDSFSQHSSRPPTDRIYEQNFDD